MKRQLACQVMKQRGGQGDDSNVAKHEPTVAMHSGGAAIDAYQASFDQALEEQASLQVAGKAVDFNLLCLTASQVKMC